MGGVASTLAALGSGVVDGDIGAIRVSQGGESWMVNLKWDQTAGKWYSDPIESAAIRSNDGDFMENFNTGGSGEPWWSYLSTQQTLSGLAKWNLRAGAIPFAGALIAAGLRLQDRAVGRCLSPSFQWQVTPYFYQYNDGDTITFDNDHQKPFWVGGETWNGTAVGDYPPSTANIGHGCVLQSPGSASSLFKTFCTYEDNIVGSLYHGASRNAGWDYVMYAVASTPSGLALGGVPTAVAAVPTKKWLYPTLYSYATGAASLGRVAAYSWECRWTS